jgi:hypothetical protein
MKLWEVILLWWKRRLSIQTSLELNASMSSSVASTPGIVVRNKIHHPGNARAATLPVFIAHSGCALIHPKILNQRLTEAIVWNDSADRMQSLLLVAVGGGGLEST